jgi:HEAT repeat protein
MVSLRDPDVTVVSKAAVALASIGDAKAIPSLTSLLGREAPEFRSSLTAVLEKFGEQAVGALVVALKHSDWRVREQAAEILGLIGRETAVLPLIDILGDDCWQVRFAAVYALGHIGGADARAAVQTLHTDTDRRVRELVPRLLDRSRRHVSRAGTSRAGTPAPRV